ncbi:translation initiation factor IF-2-like [Strigops habroptila]|uniref:translation initiation factor IF-2-like n=1 Tax=Strigops habroptila TaxID=2489341 RepID=UPI0011CFC7CD|nr:translation initiation factor IF-2-like [Strigops habroptila]
MRRAEGPGSPLCAAPLREARGGGSPPSSLYLSFFEQECRDIVARLRQAAEPSPGQGDRSALWPDAAAFVTSTPLRDSPPRDDAAPDSAARPRAPVPEAAAAPAPDPARGGPRRLPQRAAGACPGSRPRALPRTAAPRGAAQQRCGRQGPAGCGGRRAPPGPELPKAGKGLGAPRSRLPQPAGAARAGALRQPSRGLSTAIPAAASRSRLRPLRKVASPKRFRGSTTQELVCNRTQELEKNESKEWLVGTVLGVGKADQTWVCGEPSLCSEISSDPAPGCGDAVTAEQSAGDQLSQELKHVKSELERVKGELADKTAQCEAYRRTICSLQARLRAAGMCLEDAAKEEGGDLGRA